MEVNNIIELKHVGYISNETALSPLIGTGKIRLFKTIIGGSYSNIGGLGLSIQSKTPMGNTCIEREFKAYNLMGKEGINRVYNIEPEINYDLDVTLEFHFWESELNENNLSELIMYKSTDKGENWFSVGGSLNDNNQSFQCSGIRQFSKWTLGSNQITPLAVELVAFKGKRLDDNIQLIGKFTLKYKQKLTKLIQQMGFYLIHSQLWRQRVKIIIVFCGLQLRIN